MLVLKQFNLVPHKVAQGICPPNIPLLLLWSPGSQLRPDLYYWQGPSTTTTIGSSEAQLLALLSTLVLGAQPLRLYDYYYWVHRSTIGIPTIIGW